MMIYSDISGKFWHGGHMMIIGPYPLRLICVATSIFGILREMYEKGKIYFPETYADCGTMH